MPSTTFVDKITVINTPWLNDVNNLVWGVFNGATSPALARTALSLGSMALQNSSAVNITGGTISGVSIPAASLTGQVLPANGGTGLSAIGSANQVLGVNTAATGLEYKSITAGAGITITPTAGVITIATTSATPPSFSVNRNGTTQSVTNSTDTKVQFNTAEFNVGSYFDIVTNFRFTPLIAGKYLFTFSSNFSAISGTNDTLITSIAKNGTIYKSTVNYVNSPGGSGGSVSAVVDMNGSTDFIEFFVNCNGGTLTLDGTASKTHATGIKVG